MAQKIIRDGRARQALIDFGKLPMGGELIINADFGDGQSFVQRMRVRMSRVRNKIKAAKMNTSQFTMKLKGIEKKEIDGVWYDIITLQKAENALSDVEDLLEDLGDFKGLVSPGNQHRIDERNQKKAS